MTERNLPFGPKDDDHQERGVTHLQIGEEGAFTIRAGDPGLNTAGDINLDCACGNRLAVIPCRGDKGSLLQVTHKLAAMILLCKCGLVFNVNRKVRELVAQEAKKRKDEESAEGEATPE